MIKDKIKECRYAYAIDRKRVRPTSIAGKLMGLFLFLMENKLSFIKQNVSIGESTARQFEELVDWINFSIEDDYIYPYDTYVIRTIKEHVERIASVTPDYAKILEFSSMDKRKELTEKCPSEVLRKNLLITLGAIDKLINRIMEFLKNDNSKRAIQLLSYFENMKDKKVEHFDEAIQRILFYNSLFWQCKYAHNGIGRLDLILNKYYEKDLEAGIITREIAKEKIRLFIKILGRDTQAKSAALIGDTGQVIFVGGVDSNGNTIDNEITHILLELYAEHPVPDPKLILRVNSSTSDSVWLEGVKSILRGSGSPLIINEEVVMPLMIQFGYQKEDVWNFGTSACWEPLIIGKSFDQNNAITNITILDVLNNSLCKTDFNDFDSLLASVDSEIANLIGHFDLNIEFDKSPLQSLFFDDCIVKGKDFSEGGAKYNYHGLLVVGLPNLINSLLNIKEYVFNKHLCSLDDCWNCIERNFEGHEDLRLLFQQNPFKFGMANQDIIELTNHIMDKISSAVAKRTMFGEKIKVGFSSPSYIGLAKEYPASLDGRHKGDPFAVHISPISSDIDISEILDFASSLKYEGNRINGNVVDFIVPASYAKMPEKLVEILKNACKKGIFELQLNVLDKQTLIDAKAHPEKYPNLIVRVWGFSAYFNDLPEEYKDNLIQRAELYE